MKIVFQRLSRKRRILCLVRPTRRRSRLEYCNFCQESYLKGEFGTSPRWIAKYKKKANPADIKAAPIPCAGSCSNPTTPKLARIVKKFNPAMIAESNIVSLVFLFILLFSSCPLALINRRGRETLLAVPLVRFLTEKPLISIFFIFSIASTPPRVTVLFVGG